MSEIAEISATYIQCGFQSVQLKYFRGKSISKGKKLYESRHVTGVEEILNTDGQRIVVGNVIPQTRVNNPPYKVQIELDRDRSILKSQCGCKAGLSVRGCKHVAAVCIFINNESTESKTDRPQVWNQPGKSQAEKYKKGCTIENLFPCEKPLIDCNLAYNSDELQNVPNPLIDIDCLFSRYVRSEKQVEPQRIIALEEEEERRTAAFRVIKQIFNLQQSRINYGCYEISSADDLKMRVRRLTCPAPLRQKYNEHVVLTENKCLQICDRSVSQSDCYEWFEERAKRITCSSKAHRIKTRTDRFESLALNFIKGKFDGTMTEAMKYGIEMEPVARNCFAAQTGLEVHTVGLVINVQQPFLATSPDGIITSEETLLEIKCPYSCRDKDILNRETKVSNVVYLGIDEDNNVFLKKSHQYYTQIQVSMYILNMKRCHFFVFSACDNIHVNVERDDDFLSELIPKIEMFYFKHFLPLLY